MLSDHREVYRELRSRLRACGFEVHAKVLSTKLNGVPQDRARAYIVALKLVEGRGSHFPARLDSTVPLEHILLAKSRKVVVRPLQSATNKRNLRTAIDQAKRAGDTLPSCIT